MKALTHPRKVLVQNAHRELARRTSELFEPGGDPYNTAERWRIRLEHKKRLNDLFGRFVTLPPLATLPLPQSNVWLELERQAAQED